MIDPLTPLGSQRTRLQQAAYDAQLAAGLPVSDQATSLLARHRGPIDVGRCAQYIHAIQQRDWFTAAFAAHAEPVRVVVGPDVSHADAALRLVTIGDDDLWDTGKCEHACLHELAHVVTPDRGPDRQLREAAQGLDSTRGHHQAWRANFIFIVQMTLGGPAATRLRHEFASWGLPTQ